MAWRAAHPDEFKEQQRKLREHRRTYGKEWHAANREYVTLKKREYRASKEKR